MKFNINILQIALFSVLTVSCIAAAAVGYSIFKENQQKKETMDFLTH